VRRCHKRGAIAAAASYGGADRDDLEFDQVAPLRHPRLEQRRVVGLHHLPAGREVGRDPARDVAQPVRCEAPLRAEAAVDRHRVAALEALDHQVGHGTDLTSRRR